MHRERRREGEKERRREGEKERSRVWIGFNLRSFSPRLPASLPQDAFPPDVRKVGPCPERSTPG
jgi:hypothetical protein